MKNKNRMIISTGCRKSIFIQWAKTTNIPLNTRDKTGMSAFTSLIRHSTGSPSIAIRQQEEIKGIQIGKEEVKLYLKMT